MKLKNSKSQTPPPRWRVAFENMGFFDFIFFYFINLYRYLSKYGINILMALKMLLNSVKTRVIFYKVGLEIRVIFIFQRMICQ